MKRMLALALCALVVSGCALSARHARRSLAHERSAYARSIAAPTRAPVAFEHFEASARKAAESRADSAEQSDHEALARLWLETAIAEAESTQAAEERMREETALAALDERLSTLAREREQLGREAELLAAQLLARGEVERALTRAAQKPQLRVKLSRDDATRAAEALLLRSELIVRTLSTFDAPAVELTRLKSKLRDAQTLLAKDPDASLRSADQALFRALAMLALVRGREGEPDALEKASLADELASAGTRPVRGDHGLAGWLEPAFVEAQLTPEAERVIERLCALAKAHPRGPVQLATYAKSESLADARAQAVRKRFGQAGCDDARFSATSALGGDVLETRWLAY